MNLKCDLACAFARGVLDGHTKLAVDGGPDAIAHSKNLILVPLTRLDGACRVVIPVKFPTSMFVIKFPPDTRPHICLIADRLTLNINRLGAKLNPRIAFIWCQLYVDRQIEILHFNIRPDELVLRYVNRRMPHDGAVLD